MTPPGERADPLVAVQLLMRGMKAGVLARIVGMASTVVTFAVVARIVSAGQFGAMSLALAVVGVVTLVVSLQIEIQVARSPSNEVASAAIIPVAGLGILGTGVTLAAGLLVPDWLSPDVAHALVLLSPMVLGESLSQLARGRLASGGRATRLAVAHASLPVARMAAVLLAVFVEPSFSSMLAALTSGTILASGIALSLSGRFEAKASLRAPAWRLVVRSAVPLTVVALNWVLLSRADLLIVGALVEQRIVGQYAATQRVFDILLTLQASAMALVLPTTAQLAAANLPRVYAVARRLPSVALLPAGAVLAVWGDVVVSALFDVDLVAASAVYWLFGLSFGIHLVTGPAGSVWMARGGERFVAQWSAIAIGTNVALSIVLGLAFGAPGVALATVCAVLVLNIGYLSGLRPMRGARTYAYWVEVGALSVAAVGTSVFLRLLSDSDLAGLAVSAALMGALTAARLRRLPRDAGGGATGGTPPTS